MPRRKAATAVLDVSPAQAHYILGKLLEDRRITATELSGYLRRMQQEINELERRLSALKSSYQASPARPATSNRSRPSATGDEGRQRRQKKNRSSITPEQKASRQLQGQYMSLIRRFPADKRAAFKSLSKESGRQAAIDRMRAELPG